MPSPLPNAEPTFEVTSSRSKVIVNAVALLAFLCLFVGVVVVGEGAFWNALGGFGIVVFGRALVVSIPTLLRPRAVHVTLRADGVHATKGPHIAWPDLASIRISPFPGKKWPVNKHGSNTLTFVPHDLDRSLEAQPVWRRWRLRLAARIYGGPVVVMDSAFDQTLDEIVAEALRYVDVPVADER